MNEQVRNIPVSQLYPFPNRPFKVRNDDAMAELCASLRDYGVLSPLIVRPFEEGFQVLLDIMQAEDCTPSLSQAIRLKKLSQVGQLDPERIFEIMSEEKANQKERIRIEVSRLRKYFPKSYTVKQMEETILRMLEANYQKIS